MTKTAGGLLIPDTGEDGRAFASDGPMGGVPRSIARQDDDMQDRSSWCIPGRSPKNWPLAHEGARVHRRLAHRGRR